MAFSDSVRLAVGTLTVIPVGPVRRVDRPVAGPAMVLAPLAVAPLAAAAAGLGWGAVRLGWPVLIGALIVVAALALGTRAMHLDGLTDTVDGLGTGWNRDKALAVMRRGDVGPMGVAALILVLGAQVAAVAVLIPSWPGAVQLFVLVCSSRVALSLVCRAGVPAARADGLGAAVAGSVSTLAAALGWVVVAALVTLLALWRGQPWEGAVTSVLVTVTVVMLLVRRCVRRFSGVTGDVMGAAVEIAFTTLVVLAAR